MREIVTITSEGVTLRQELADAGSRLAAGLVDLSVMTMLVFVLFLFVGIVGAADPTGASGFFFGLVIGGLVLILLGYGVLFHRFAHGKTPGKMLLGLQVVSSDGYPPSFLALLLRGLLWPIDVLPLFALPLGLVAIVFSPRRQRLGDLVAGTVVVHAPGARRLVEPWPRETYSGLERKSLPFSPMSLARLDARDVEFLRELLTRPSLQPVERRRLFVETAKHYSERLELGPFLDARTVLRELYLYAREFRGAQSA